MITGNTATKIGYEGRTNNYEPKMMNLEKIMEINRRIEMMALDYDIPYPSGTQLRDWQREIMNGN